MTNTNQAAKIEALKSEYDSMFQLWNAGDRRDSKVAAKLQLLAAKLESARS